MVNGSWHGSIDEFLFDLKKKRKFSIHPISSGVLNSKDLVMLPYNDIINSKKF